MDHVVSAVLNESAMKVWCSSMQDVYLKIGLTAWAVIQVLYSIPIPFKFLLNDLMLSNIISNLASSSTPGIEPYNPELSSLPPELAFQVITAKYITMGTLAVSCWCLPIGLVDEVYIQIYIWETLINIDNDCNLLLERRLRLPTIVYFVSR